MKVKNFQNKKGEGARNGSKSENVLEKSILRAVATMYQLGGCRAKISE